jgi:hypothetical protein
VGTIPKDLATLIVLSALPPKTIHAFQSTAMSFFTNCFYKQAATFVENIGCSFTNIAVFLIVILPELDESINCCKLC